MSIAADSPLSSSNSDEFASFLEAQLDVASEEDEFEGFNCTNELNDHPRIKRPKLDDSDPHNSIPGESHIENVCPPHPGYVGGMCIRCGHKVENESGVKLSYIHESMTLANCEIARLRDKSFKRLMSNKKLILVLDLDHTLLNSTRFVDITTEETYLTYPKETLPDAVKDTLFHLDEIHMMTKLRPYVDDFLREASKMFEMYVYTMGERAYAMQVANILDPHKVYFNSTVIAHEDSTQSHQKGLDVVLAQDNVVLILDDTEAVWSNHKGNLILVERYHFFQSSCKQFGFKCKSLSERKEDESKNDGALATILKILQRVHSLYFHQENSDNLLNQDVRKLLEKVRKEVLQGCKIVFSRIFPTKFPGKKHHLWRMAEHLGATCSTKLDELVTHVVSTDVSTGKSRWAVNQNKFLVHPGWIEACNYLWRKEPEERFPVNQEKISDSSSTQE
ncbi:protein phosphatase [Lithospermum erythrorhizon]|uniref:RNA polymerase II C-terminal domain phosphatase-like n=1 Tax=Lithospermum erythrorhizon TaxID=34254 RepID=A0AAV3QW51_LITER